MESSIPRGWYGIIFERTEKFFHGLDSIDIREAVNPIASVPMQRAAMQMAWHVIVVSRRFRAS
jgi:hypothetical protein